MAETDHLALLRPLTDDEYDLPRLRLHANQYKRIVLRLENPLGKPLANVHVCYRDFDLFYQPWAHGARPRTAPVAGGYYYYWLTDYQLEELQKRPQGVRFILNGTRCGEHDLVIVWAVDGVDHRRTIKVLVEPEPG
jgi:hypothetical protein